MTPRDLDIGLEVLDHQVLDKDGRRCGKIDDLAIVGGPGESPEIVAILVGPGYWGTRAGWIGRLAGRLGGNARVRVSWAEVASVDSAVHLKRDATTLGLGRGDDRARRYIERIPGSRR